MTEFDRETRVLSTISKGSSISQRELARKTGTSLGLINVILKRLTKTGYIRVSQLNKRKLEYLLTPEGLLEAAKRTYRCVTSTIQTYNQLRSNIATLLNGLHRTGYDYFSVHGDGDLSILVQSTFSESLEDKPVTLGKQHRNDPRAVVLNVSPEQIPAGFKGDVVNVIERIALG